MVHDFLHQCSPTIPYGGTDQRFFQRCKKSTNQHFLVIESEEVIMYPFICHHYHFCLKIKNGTLTQTQRRSNLGKRSHHCFQKILNNIGTPLHKISMAVNFAFLIRKNSRNLRIILHTHIYTEIFLIRKVSKILLLHAMLSTFSLLDFKMLIVSP